MVGQRSPQRGMFTVDQQCPDLVGRDRLHGFLGQHGRELFRDADFAGLCRPDNGRKSVPPSLLCSALLWPTHDRVSGAEATRRAKPELRCRVALKVDIDAQPFARSTLQLLRSQLVISEQAQAIFRRSVEFTRQTRYLAGRRMEAALHTTITLGHGAVEDTCNLIAHGIAKLCRVLEWLAGQEPAAWAAAHGLGRFFAPSIKGTADSNWDDAEALETFLSGLIADGQRRLSLARQARAQLEDSSVEDERVTLTA